MGEHACERAHTHTHTHTHTRSGLFRAHPCLSIKSSVHGPEAAQEVPDLGGGGGSAAVSALALPLPLRVGGLSNRLGFLGEAANN